MADDRIATLSQRFRTHDQRRRPQTPRMRERKSFYLDLSVVAQVDAAYRTTNHAFYPGTLSKSVFLETLIRYGLDHLDAFKDELIRAQDEEHAPSTP